MVSSSSGMCHGMYILSYDKQSSSVSRFLFVVVGLVAVSPSISIDRGALAPLASAAQGPTYPFEAATSRVSSVQGQPFSRNHLSTSRWPPNAAYAHVDVRVPHGQVVFAQPLQHPSRADSRSQTRTSTSRSTGSRSRAPLQHLELAALAANAHVDAPRAAVRARHFSTSRWQPFAAARARVLVHGRSFARAHFNISRWPPFAAFSHVSLAPLAAVLARPLQHLEVAALRRARARLIVPRAPFSRAHFSTSRWPPSPRRSRRHVNSSHAQPSRVPISICGCRGGRPAARARPGSTGSRALAPTSATRGGRPSPRPSTYPHPTGSCLRNFPHRSISAAAPAAGTPQPRRAPTGSRSRAPLQHLEVAAPRRVPARVLVPRAVVCARPLQHLEVAALRRVLARLLVPREAVSRAHCSVSRWRPPPRSCTRPPCSGDPAEEDSSAQTSVQTSRRERYLSDPLSSRRPRRACRGSPCGAPRGPARVPPKLSGREVSVRSAASRDSLAG